jgi:hypothetical protein
MGPYEHYAEAQSIADIIAGQGYSAAAENIRTAIAAGCTGTEIYMGLRFHLAPLVDAVALDEKTRLRIRMLHDAIDYALSPAQG